MVRDIWPAPAKLNLFLHVTGRRANGYHTLQSVFQFLDYGDELRFSIQPTPGIRLVSELPGVDPEDNLVVRAARSLQAKTGCTKGAEISLLKRLPMGGGVGGGSSDAATVLVGLNELWQTGLSTDALAELGLALGADVPVFVRGRAAWAEGVGEQLTPVDLPEPWFLVVKPPVTISTAEVFSDPELTRDSAPITIPDFLAGAGHNDCEPVVRKRYPVVGQVIDWLSKFSPSRLTGTGACVYAGFASEAEANEVLNQLPAEWSGFVAKGLNQSPLFRED